MNWRPPQLHQVVIHKTGPLFVDDPARFLRDQLGDDALAVVECAAQVLVVQLADVPFDAATLHVQAFSSKRQAQARLARSGGGWMGDAVCENGGGAAAGVAAWARTGRQLCLGKAVADSPGSMMREARVRPYRLPVPLVEGQPAEIEFVDYYAIDADTGAMDCIGHRVVDVRAFKGA